MWRYTLLSAVFLGMVLACGKFTLSPEGTLAAVDTEFKVRTTVECATKCLSVRECITFSYREPTKLCRLSVDVPLTGEGERIDSDGTVYTRLLQCSPGWVLNPISKTCLLFGTDMKSWEDAKEVCEAMGACLVTLDSYEDMVWFMEYREKTNDSHSQEYWLAARYNNSIGSYQWTNGGTLGLEPESNWWFNVSSNYDEPNRSGDCVGSYGGIKGFALRDVYCDSRYEADYICETFQ